MLHVFLRRQTDNRESRLDEILDGMRFSRRDDIIVRLGMLEHAPHREFPLQRSLSRLRKVVRQSPLS